MERPSLLELPAYGWTPRKHQRALWRYLERGGRRGVAVWHRRAGKDDVALHWAAVSMVQRIGNYWHMLPEAAQARKAIWQAVNPHTGKRRIDEAFPHELRANTNEQEMFIRFVNGSTWQVVGSDNYNSLVGAAPVGIVFSEWALANPTSWAFMRPILLENGGWALFITTPRGRNHASAFYEGAKADASWYAERLTVQDTGLFAPDQLAQELKEYIRDYGEDDGRARYEQEYECSFDAAIQGSYFGKLMQAAEDQGRIGVVPHDPRYPVTTAWDLGVSNATVIWFVQQVGSDVRVIDSLAGTGEGVDYYAREVKAKPYTYKLHLLPHDVDHRSWGAVGAETRLSALRKLGVAPIRVLPADNVEEGIAALRLLLPRCRFNKATTVRVVEALQQYRRRWDEANKVYQTKPLHDWSSDFVDPGRYLAMGLREDVIELPPQVDEFANAGWGSGDWMAG